VSRREKLRQAARAFAKSEVCAAVPERDAVTERLDRNKRILSEIEAELLHKTGNEILLGDADQWLFENCALIQQHLSIAREAISQSRNRWLGLSPRKYSDVSLNVGNLAQEFVAQVEGRITLRDLSEFINVFQHAKPLEYAELWALPNMIRLAVTDKLCLLAKDSGNNGDGWRLARIQNCIRSLQRWDSLNWIRFVERQCIAGRILRRDPTGTYARMDFESRNHYLRIVEKLSRRSGFSQEFVANMALELATSAGKKQIETSPISENSEVCKQCHVGYYLVGEGRETLEKRIGYTPEWNKRLEQKFSRAPMAYYLGAIMAVWTIAIAGIGLGGRLWYFGTPIGLVLNFVLILLTGGIVAQFSIDLVNWIATTIVPPRRLMRLDFSNGIPDAHRTLIAVPTMITNEQALYQLIRQLEVRYLANRDNNLLFALLTDFPDADRESMPDDDRLLRIAAAEIRRLNAEYCRHKPAGFYFLHRPRKWNPRERVWMGEERKRGKLAALNRLLTTNSKEDFCVRIGDLERLGGVRYVITLDTDTQLPPQAGRKLVGRMAHPLNAPRFDPRTHCVSEGYAIMQPRIGVGFPEARRSLYSWLFAGDAGIDPYTGQTSNLYFDLFSRGSYIGKGIYDVDAFEKAVAGRFPDNRILSHDLIEGCYASCGVASDVELFEGFPSRLLADQYRRHRWIRGDWQIAAWIMPKVPTPYGMKTNPLSRLSRWKIFDNLRRSLTPVFQLGFLLSALPFAPSHPIFLLAVALLAISGIPSVASVIGFFRKPVGTPWELYLTQQSCRWLRTVAGELVSWCMVPYTAWSNLDAIVRALYRVHISRRKNLEWTTSTETEARSDFGLSKHYRVMWPCLVSSLALFGLLLMKAPSALFIAFPLIVAWLAAPWLAWHVSKPLGTKTPSLSEDQTGGVRRWARQTWHFFEIHANASNHGLPPDNVQNDLPQPVVRNTSPTNIGLGLTSTLAAYDLGYLSASAMLERTDRALNALRRLERYRGHFFNWYDLRTMKPLEPRYVSTVDSGNLWGSLIVLRAGLEELLQRPLVHPRLGEGLCDTLEVIASLSHRLVGEKVKRRFNRVILELRSACREAFSCGALRTDLALVKIRPLVARLHALTQMSAVSIATDANKASQLPSDNRKALDASVLEWTKTFENQVEQAQAELARLAFWTRFSSLLRLSDEFPIDSEDYRNLRDYLQDLDAHCTLRQLPDAAKNAAGLAQKILDTLTSYPQAHKEGVLKIVYQLSAFRRAAETAAWEATQQLAQIASLIEACRSFCQMDFRFLFNSRRQLLSVGFNASERRLDDSCYDLMASESRMTSFLAVSHGQIPLEHWSALGRMVTIIRNKPALMSWAGSAFEYLMPLLFMPSHPGTLLEVSCRTALSEQTHDAFRRKIPWGISESCFHQTDSKGFLQYRAFGVSSLRLQKLREEYTVIAPYASALAIGIAPHAVYKNLVHLERLGSLSGKGFYDALDYSSSDCPRDGRAALCPIVMAHHSGMTLMAFANLLLDNPMVRRFIKDPNCEAHNLLLQERVPQAIRPML
jgi:hypothetical protein